MAFCCFLIKVCQQEFHQENSQESRNCSRYFNQETDNSQKNASETTVKSHIQRSPLPAAARGRAIWHWLFFHLADLIQMHLLAKSKNMAVRDSGNVIAKCLAISIQQRRRTKQGRSDAKLPTHNMQAGDRIEVTSLPVVISKEI